MGWPEALDDAEQVLRGAEQTIVSGDPPSAIRIDWHGLGPLPQELGSRALQVLEGTRVMEQRVAKAIDDLARPGRHRGAELQGHRPEAVLFDGRG